MKNFTTLFIIVFFTQLGNAANTDWYAAGNTNKMIWSHQETQRVNDQNLITQNYNNGCQLAYDDVQRGYAIRSLPYYNSHILNAYNEGYEKCFNYYSNQMLNTPSFDFMWNKINNISSCSDAKNTFSIIQKWWSKANKSSRDFYKQHSLGEDYNKKRKQFCTTEQPEQEQDPETAQ